MKSFLNKLPPFGIPVKITVHKKQFPGKHVFFKNGSMVHKEPNSRLLFVKKHGWFDDDKNYPAFWDDNKIEKYKINI